MVRRTKRYTRRHKRKGARGTKRRGVGLKRRPSKRRTHRTRRTRRTRRRVGVFSGATKLQSAAKAKAQSVVVKQPNPDVKVNNDHANERICMFCKKPGHWKTCDENDCIMKDWRDEKYWKKTVFEKSKIEGKPDYRKKDMQDDYWKKFSKKYESNFKEERERRKKYGRRRGKNPAVSS